MDVFSIASFIATLLNPLMEVFKKMSKKKPDFKITNFYITTDESNKPILVCSVMKLTRSDFTLPIGKMNLGFWNAFKLEPIIPNDRWIRIRERYQSDRYVTFGYRPLELLKPESTTGVLMFALPVQPIKGKTKFQIFNDKTFITLKY